MWGILFIDSDLNFLVSVVWWICHACWLIPSSAMFCFSGLVYCLLNLLFCGLKDLVHLGISALFLCGDGNVVYKIKSDDPFSLCMCFVA